MIKWYCPNCHSKKESGDNIKSVLCPCGYFMKKITAQKTLKEVEDGKWKIR